MLHARLFSLLLAAAAITGAQQPAPSVDKAAAQCRLTERIVESNAALAVRNPQAAQGAINRIRPVRDACAAFQAEPNAQTVAAVISAMGDYDPQTLPPQERLAKLEAKASGASGPQLFYQLAPLAKAAFDAGDLIKARSYADQLLALAPQYPKDWNYGNAIYYGHMVLGRVELAQGNTMLAEHHLIQSAQTTGSPQLNTFGPNTSLAKDLLEKGDTAPVLQYFALIQTFWQMNRGKPAEWSAQVQSGKIPDFGANLLY
ncbi:MAG TPA: hypothetical protein VKB79_26415 [Bryobacteraceae bacterium]|nr:hypothetical protein [Bryobacteraceae bacterium]